MKKILCAVLALFMLVTLTSCGSKPSEPEKTSGEFEPLLDTDTDCSITVAGSYDNFEALEMEFDRFNETYSSGRQRKTQYFLFLYLDDRE